MFLRRSKHERAYSYFDFINGIVHLILLKENTFYPYKPDIFEKTYAEVF